MAPEFFHYLSFLCVGYEGLWIRALPDTAAGIQSSLGALIASAPTSKIAEPERQVSLLHTMEKNKKFLDDIFRDVNVPSKGGSEAYSAEESYR